MLSPWVPQSSALLGRLADSRAFLPTIRELRAHIVTAASSHRSRRNVDQHHGIHGAKIKPTALVVVLSPIDAIDGWRKPGLCAERPLT